MMMMTMMMMMFDEKRLNAALGVTRHPADLVRVARGRRRDGRPGDAVVRGPCQSQRQRRLVLRQRQRDARQFHWRWQLDCGYWGAPNYNNNIIN